MSSIATQQKFTNLRKRLDQLGYRHPLGIESLPLVERLFADLVHTTESLKKAKLKGTQSHKAQNGVDSQIEPYKSDNAKLVKENNELHQQLIRTKEELDASVKDLKQSLRKLEHENADLRFLNNQYVHKMRILEKESRQKSEKILQLQEKNLHAVVQTPDGRKKNIPFRRQRMELDSTVPAPASGHVTPPVSLVTDDPYVADLMKVADDNIAGLKADVRILAEEKSNIEGKVKVLQKQMQTRDAEISRLTMMLEGGRPHDVVALESRNRGNERLISHLNIQIDYLQQKTQDLQRQLDAAQSKAERESHEKRSLDAHNLNLQRELQSVDLMAQQLQSEKDIALTTADSEVNQAKLQLDRSRSELQTMDMSIAQLRAERERLMVETDELRSLLCQEQENRLLVDELVDKVQQDKRALSLRINKLTNNERDLVLEVDRLKYRGGAVKGKRGKGPGPVEVALKGLEHERDYWRGETDVLQKLLKTRTASLARSPRSGPTSPSRSRSSSPTRQPRSRPNSPTRQPRSRPNTPTRQPRSRPTSPSRAARSRPDSPTRQPPCTPTKAKSKTKTKNGVNLTPNNSTKADIKTATHYESIVRLLEEERDHYKRECDVLKAMHSRPGSPYRSLHNSRILDDQPELQRVTQERDELQTLLNKFERHMAEIQANVKVLTAERNKLNDMYEETKAELSRVRQQLVRSPKASAKTSLAAQAMLRRLEGERDDAVGELHRMTTERDTLRERLKIATETQLSDRARLEQKVEDLEATLRVVEAERGAAEDKSFSLQKFADNLELELSQQSQQLLAAREDAAQNTATANQMRLLAEQAERHLEESESRVARRDAELRAATDRATQLEDQVSEWQRRRRMDQSEADRQAAALSALDREKDLLQTAVDEKTERLVLMEEDLSAKEKMMSQMRQSIGELEAVIQRSSDDSGGKDREIHSLRRQLDGLSEELSEVGRGREVALRENRRLQDDLTTMTRENQSVSNELQEAVEDKERLRAQVHDYMTEVKRVEDVLAAKEQERSDLLEQYRSLSAEAERYETQTHQLESQGSNMRLELVTKETEVRRLRERLDDLDRDLLQQQQATHGYDSQVCGLTRAVASLEDAVRLSEAEKHAALQDLAAVRDLCARLEAGRDSLQRQLTGKTLDHEKLQTLLDDMKHESEALRAQVASERTTVQSLEGLLHNNREKEFQTQLSAQEKGTEVQILRDRLALNDSKIDSQNRELSTLRNRNIDLESDIEKLRRQLTSEKFERERTAQELKRTGQGSLGEARRPRYSSPVGQRRSGSPARGSPYSPIAGASREDSSTSGRMDS